MSNKKNILSMLLVSIVTCCSVSPFDSLNRRLAIDDSQKINTCEQLKADSYDTFYSEETQKCLKEDMYDAKDVYAKINKLITSNNTTIDDIENFKASYKKREKCIKPKKAKEVYIESTRFETEYTYDANYYKEAYNICKDEEYFEKEKVEKILENYILKDELKSVEDKLEDKKAEIKKQEREKEYKNYLSKLENDPLMQKLKAVAPDFYNLPIYESEICPSVFDFVRGLQKTLQNAALVGNKKISDLYFEKNYTFQKKDNNTLVIKIENEPICTMVKQNNKVIITEMFGETGGYLFQVKEICPEGRGLSRDAIEFYQAFGKVKPVYLENGDVIFIRQ